MGVGGVILVVVVSVVIMAGVVACGWRLVLLLGRRTGRPATSFMATVTVAAIVMAPFLVKGR